MGRTQRAEPERVAAGRFLVTYGGADGAGAASIGDGPGATAARGAHALGRGSNPDSPVYASNAVGWPACWPAGRPVGHSTSAAPGCGRLGQRTGGNAGTCSDRAGGSWAAKPAPIEAGHGVSKSEADPLGKKTSKKKRRRALWRDGGKKTDGKKTTIFKPAKSPDFQTGPDRPNRNSPPPAWATPAAPADS